MEELNSIYKRKYKEVDSKYKQWLQLVSSGLCDEEPSQLYRVIDRNVRLAGHQHRIFYERPESPLEFRMKVIDLLGSTQKRDLYTFYDRIGEPYIRDSEEAGNRCCGKAMVPVSDHCYRCSECYNSVENFDNIAVASVTVPEKSTKYKRQDYFIEVIRKKQKKYIFKISETDMEVLLHFFREVENNWHKVFPTKTFISYPFLFRKGLELLGNYDYILKIWKMTNSDDYLKRNDQKWKKICELLNYEFISSCTY